MTQRISALALASLALWAGAQPTHVAIAQPAAAAPRPALPRPKRTAPPAVPPVVLGNIRIETIPWGRSRDLGQNGGYIAALDRRTGRELWILKVYGVTYDTKMEEDVQDIFIKKMTKVSPTRLSILDEDGRRYFVDVKTRSVARR
jgi:hypothetical protein